MEDNYSVDKTFEKADFKTNPLQKGEYENCRFNNCNFSESSIEGSKFIDCHFTGCNLSLAKTDGTCLQNVTFKDCKMLGLRMDRCDAFGLAFSFDGCTLNHSSFYKLKIKKTVFRNCQMHEMDFTEADLSNTILDQCDLTGTTFENTTLEKADFRTAYNYSINPEINAVKKAKFSIPAVIGLLDKYDITIEH